ncbi:MAG: GMC family oxidoreductase N-terminal domain-containing protein, partial [Chloroflexota bacterium]
MADSYDVILVGTGFASSLFLHSYLEKAPATARVLVLERGKVDTHSWQVQHDRTSSKRAKDTFVNQHPYKEWVYNPSFGGGSNCWWAVTPRFLPNDFQMRSMYDVGVDWPIRYDDLEPFYGQAEDILAISGPSDDSPFPRSSPYPQPPHRFTDPDKILKAAYPDLFFHQPTARARVSTTKRPRCCATGSCGLCPINAKFTVMNELQHLYDDPRVTLTLEATVQTVETQGGQASGVTYRQAGREIQSNADLIILGANALFNPHILQRSNIEHPFLGKYLN